MNAVEIEEALSELALQPFNADDFAYEFLAAFGHKEVALRRSLCWRPTVSLLKQKI